MSTLDLEKVQAAFWNIPNIKTFGKGETLTADQAIERAGLDWIVEQRPIYALDEQGCEIAVETHVANVRGDTQEVLGIVGNRYVPLDNRDTFGLAEAVAKQSGAHWLGGGLSHGSSRVHAVLALDKTIDLGISGEDILPLLFVSNGHDGSLAVRLRVAPMRLACLNGMLVRTKVRFDWSTRHTTNVESRVEEARQALQLVEKYVASVEERMRKLVKIPMGARPFSRFLAELVPLPQGVLVSDQTLHDRRVKRVETVRAAIRACHRAPDLDVVSATAYGALQAVTAYATHDAPRRGSDRAFKAISEEHALVRRATTLLMRA